VKIKINIIMGGKENFIMKLHEKPYRVLTIDGGGMRGLYSATVLDTLSRRFACNTNSELLDIGKGFDLIVGTSTGGILACALAAGVKTTEIINLYREEGSNIFQDPITDKWKRWAWRNRKTPANSSTTLITFIILILLRSLHFNKKIKIDQISLLIFSVF